MKTKKELPDFKFTPPTPDVEECPMNNLKNRMKSKYAQIYGTLDFNFLRFEGENLNVYQSFYNAFLNYNLMIYMNYNKSNGTYAPFVIYNADKKYLIGGAFEFEQTAQMASIEKCFEIVDELGLHLQSSTLIDKFEDWYCDKELEHLNNGTDFTPKEVFEYFKPHIKFSLYNQKYK